MTKSTKFQVALRRNKQKREWSQFRNSFGKITGIALKDNQLVEAEVSFELNRRLFEAIGVKRATGELDRTNEQTAEQAFGIVERFCSTCSPSDWVLFMSNYEDFDLRFSPSMLASKFSDILKFEGDTIYLFDKSLAKCIGVDYYASELCGDWRYTTDIW